jgi:hypothetical protein
MARKDNDAWMMADDEHAGPVPFSGPKGLLKGYDASKRKLGSKSGGTVTPEILSRAGKHVPREKTWQNNRNFTGAVPKSMPDVPGKKPLDWRDRDYNKGGDMNPNVGLSQHDVPTTKAGKAAKMEKVMREFENKNLHSGSDSGPTVRNRNQAIAIGLKMSGQSRK